MSGDVKDPQTLLRSAFDAVIGMVRADFPDKTKNLETADTSTPEGLARLRGWIDRQNYQDAGHTFESTLNNKAEHIDGRNGNGDMIHMDVTNLPLKISYDPVLNLSAIAAHEAGHAVTDKGNARGDGADLSSGFDLALLRVNARTHELAADGFGTPYLVTKGAAHMEDIDLSALNRAVGACLGDMEHNTAIVLDAIQVRYTERQLADKTPDEVRAMADGLATEFASKEDPRDNTRLMQRISPMGEKEDANLADFMNRASQPGWQEWMRGLAEFCLAADSSSDAFYPAARVVSTVIANEGALETPALSRTFDVRGAFWDNVADVISWKALEIGMEKTLDPSYKKPKARAPGSASP